ncbi:MAG: ABC transporter permease, partial [Oscillospiraceae bacterium]|nr:ABC transporter permease [Oscillospiraceae bacterium]
LNVHEVIACIMCNYIGMYAVNYLIKNSNVYDALKNQTIDMTRAAIPKAGLDKIFYSLKGRFMDSSSVNAGIHIALALAVVMYIILNKTVLGYELKACSLNRYASKYAGIQEKRSILLSLTIAGSLSGIAGGLMYLAPAGGLHINVVETLSAQGFNGIPVALLGLSNPIGIIFSALFVAHIDQGGYYLQRLEYMPQIIDIIIAVIIYFSAFALLMRQAIGAIQSRLSSRSGKRLIEGAADAQEASKHD